MPIFNLQYKPLTRNQLSKTNTSLRHPLLPSKMKKLSLLTTFLVSSPASGFVSFGLKARHPSKHALLNDPFACSEVPASDGPKSNDSSEMHHGITVANLLPAVLLFTTSLPAEAAVGGAPVPSALWAYGHYFSIIAIFGCLSAEKTLVKPGMSEEEENMVVKLDVLYGVMAALL